MLAQKIPSAYNRITGNEAGTHGGETDMTMSDYKELVMAAAGWDQKFSIAQADIDALIEAGLKKNQTPGITAWALMEYAI